MSAKPQARMWWEPPIQRKKAEISNQVVKTTREPKKFNKINKLHQLVPINGWIEKTFFANGRVTVELVE